MTRRLAARLALLASLLVLPSAASAARPGASHPWAGATATTIQEVVPDDATAGAEVPDDPADVADAADATDPAEKRWPEDPADAAAGGDDAGSPRGPRVGSAA